MVTPKLKELRGIFEALKGDIKVKISTEEDEGRRAKAINKRYQLTEESTLNLKSRDASEGEVLRKLASGRHYGRGRHKRYGSGGSDLCRYVITVQRQRLMDGGTGAHLILC